MYLSDIQIVNFKNYIEKRYSFSPDINCIVGLNGVGKTNLLDAIYYLSMSKSYFSNMDNMNIRHGEEFFAIHGDFVFDSLEGQSRVSCIQQSGKRKVLKFNDKEYNRLADHIGLIPSVMISPYDIDYINGMADVRRKYFDSILSQLDKNYLDKLMIYNKLIANRNALLKQMYENDHFVEDELVVWDNQLISVAHFIYEKRKGFIHDFLPIFMHYFSTITAHKEQVNIQYQSSLANSDMQTLLKENRQRDFYSQHTSNGIHKDDYLFEMNNFVVKRYCSQGQQKSFLIALKLAQGEYVKQIKGKCPLLLLDDIFDKLDENRITELISMVNGKGFGQVFITDTDKDRISNLLTNNNINFNLIEIEA